MKKQNKLALASSPYLRQHAENPVDWYEWGEEALQKAKLENKPLIISIGYAACHWCHVMAHESFSNEEIADYMNKNFVCIKVDREERPDIDQIYMEAAHLITGRGGWPLNAVTLPDGRPFYAGTYFPESQWLNVLQQLTEVFKNDFQRVLKATDSITKGINANPFERHQLNTTYTIDEYHTSFKHHISGIDFKLGGYNKAPKFMMPVGFEFLLQYHVLTGDKKALNAVTVALDAMASGGLFDQIGGGFARYSTDENWIVPHFEKMLYDNAQLISLYSKGFQLTKNVFYKETVEKTINFVERELLDKSGGFYASIDADSEYEEGKFYVWSQAEIKSVVDKVDKEIILDFYNIREEGNWEDGKNILYFTKDKKQFANENGIELSQFEEILQKANQKLFSTRSKRVRPTTDDKILCSWNALMISGYVNAYKAFVDDKYLQGALSTAEFIESQLLGNDGSLFRVYKDGKPSTTAFLDDYALLATAFLDLYEITFDIHWLNRSKLLTEYVWEHFGNNDKSMFFYTSDSSESLVARKYEYSDNVIPASNSVFAHVLYRLGVLYENPDYLATSERMMLAVKEELIQFGVYYAHWAALLGRFSYPQTELAIIGNDVLKIASQIQLNYLPLTVIAGGISENLPLLSNRKVENKTLMYVCKNKSCNLPVESVEKALEEILS